MKTKIYALIGVIALLLCFTNITYSTDDTLVTYYRAGMTIEGTIPDIDSAEVLYTQWFDATLLDGQTMYFTALYNTTGTTADTQRVIIQGRNPSIPALQMNIDTILLVGSSATVYQSAITLSAYFPEWRLRTEEKSSASDNEANGYMKWSIYAPTNDVVPPKLNLGNY